MNNLNPESAHVDGAFDEILLDCIDRALDTFGQTTKQVVYWNLTQQDDIQGRGGILKNPEAFERALWKMFGPGVACIRWEIIREIKNGFDLDDKAKIEDIPTAFRQAMRKVSKIDDYD